MKLFKFKDSDLVLGFVTGTGVDHQFYYIGDWVIEVVNGEASWCWDLDSRDHLGESLGEMGECKVYRLDRDFFEYNLAGYVPLSNFGYCLEGVMLKTGGLK